MTIQITKLIAISIYNVGITAKIILPLTFLSLTLFILSNKGKSLTLEIENFVETRFDDNDEKLITKEAVSKQRQKINPELFIDLNDNFMKEFLESEEYELFVDDKITLEQAKAQIEEKNIETLNRTIMQLRIKKNK